MSSSPNMGLTLWDGSGGSSPYDHNQLVANFTQLDIHDHTPGKGVQIPTDGIEDGAVTGPKIGAGVISGANLEDDSITSDKLRDGAVTTSKLADGAVTEPKLGTGAVTAGKIGIGQVNAFHLAQPSVLTAHIYDGAVTQGKLASPMNSAYHTLFQHIIRPVGIEKTGIYHGRNSGAYVSDGEDNSSPLPLFWWDPLDFVVPNLTTVLRLRVQVANNNNNPSARFQFGLHRVNGVGGPNGTIRYFLADPRHPGSLVDFQGPSAGAFNQKDSGDFAPPASANYYTIGIRQYGTVDANSVTAFTCQLQVRWE